MPINPQADKYLHSKLPIDDDEKILAVYKHHWFAYASSWIVGIFVVTLAMGLAAAFSVFGGSDGAASSHSDVILIATGFFSVLILAGTSLPVYLRSQEQLVLTEEAILQMLQPSLFASKVSQLSLQHIADVSVRQDFFGTILGYGHITLETPGEQDNYKFAMLPNPHQAAREIIAAHENFDAALQGGRIASTLRTAMPQAPQIDPQQYQQFLQYQQMLAQQQQIGQSNDPTNPPQSPPSQNPQ
jgi:hypothetical protein